MIVKTFGDSALIRGLAPRSFFGENAAYSGTGFSPRSCGQEFRPNIRRQALVMEELMKILSKPDNIPIGIMAPLVAFFVWLAISQGRRHDKLEEEGKKDAIYDEMIR
jgi:hypothetical protein